MKTPERIESPANARDMHESLSEPALRREANRLALQLEQALLNPAADRDDFLRTVERYAEVVQALRQGSSPGKPRFEARAERPTSLSSGTASPIKTLAVSLDRPEVDLFMAFASTVVLILSLLFAM